MEEDNERQSGNIKNEYYTILDDEENEKLYFEKVKTMIK